MVIANTPHYLSINAGSSSIKFALYRADPALCRVFEGAIEGIGGGHGSFCVRGAARDTFSRHFPIPERITAVNVLIEWLVERLEAGNLAAVAHRVVHDWPYYCATQIVSDAMLGTLCDSVTSDPEHLPQQIHLIDTLRRRYPRAVHIACFDSAFHMAMPAVASMLPIPAGVRRYGSHGLSCAYLMRELDRVAGPRAVAGKVILAHLGGGASITAVRDGTSRDTSMGLTPAQFNHIVKCEASLPGVSGRSADLRVLLQHEAADQRAADAIALFVYQARKAICAMAGAIDGVQTLIFSGGIGENAAVVRARICQGLQHLGLVLDPECNERHDLLISARTSAVAVRVIRTDEQWMMADEARRLLASPPVEEPELILQQ